MNNLKAKIHDECLEHERGGNMNEIKLKPCPFCGKINTLTITNCVELEECKNFEGCDFDGYKTICCDVNKGGCGAAAGYAKDESLMIEKWNMRAGEENERP